MFWIIVLLIIAVIFVLVAIQTQNKKKAVQNLSNDERLKGAKIFKDMIETPMAITENGDIGFINVSTKEIKVFNIEDVNGFEILIDGKNIANVGGAIAGGLLFGGVGAIIGGGAKKEKINSVNLLFKINDFNNPTITVPLLTSGTKKGSMVDQQLQKEITELTSTLEVVEKKIKNHA